MSDGRSSAADSGAESDDSVTDSDSGEPGGGPKRVVSETSVDDILDSLNDAQSSEPDDTGPNEPEDTASSESDEGDETAPKTQLDGDYVDSVSDDVPIEDGLSDPETATDGARTETDAEHVTVGDDSESQPSTEPESESMAPIDDESSTDNAADAESLATDTANDESPASEDAADESPTADPAAEAPSLSDEQLDALADRVDQGTVTGADVRAAEAGEGREETSDIGDIELTMDDLEATAATTGASPPADGADDLDADAGPLAGSIDDTDNDPDSTEEEGSTGFVDRLKGLFFG